jgi:hypothetical protein
MSKLTTEDHCCVWCKQSFTVASCTVAQMVMDGVVYDRIRYGFEVSRCEMADALAEHFHRPERCPDCGVALRQFHHADCDREQCPRCKRQLLSCWCSKREVNRLENDA